MATKDDKSAASKEEEEQVQRYLALHYGDAVVAFRKYDEQWHPALLRKVRPGCNSMMKVDWLDPTFTYECWAGEEIFNLSKIRCFYPHPEILLTDELRRNLNTTKSLNRFLLWMKAFLSLKERKLTTGSSYLETVSKKQTLVGTVDVGAIEKHKKMLEDKDFADVTIECKDGTTTAHASIIFTALPFLKNYIKKSASGASGCVCSLNLSHASVKHVRSVLSFLYVGSTSWAERMDALSVGILAHELGLDALVEEACTRASRADTRAEFSQLRMFAQALKTRPNHKESFNSIKRLLVLSIQQNRDFLFD